MSFIADFARINLNAPWLTTFADIHTAFATDNPKLPLYEWLNTYFAHHGIDISNGHGTPATFTHQDKLEHGTTYETHIGQCATIPTRDNLHDWFGACIWSVFPKTKALLNAKHLAHMNNNNTANGRNRLRDTITVFDENGAIVVISDELVGHDIATALIGFDWVNALVSTRQYWSDYTQNDTDKKAKVFIFGHALLEQLVNPYKSLCSHTLILPVPPVFFDMNLDEQSTFVDDFLCFSMNNFLKVGVTPRQLHPLPILGVPFFWKNNDPTFYHDTYVFRAGRQRRRDNV